MKWSYEERLACLGLYSLERRLWGYLSETFKISNGFECIDPEKFFRRARTTQLRGHCDKLFKDRSKQLCRSNFFSQRVANLVSYWNLLIGEPDIYVNLHLFIYLFIYLFIV